MSNVDAAPDRFSVSVRPTTGRQRAEKIKGADLDTYDDVKRMRANDERDGSMCFPLVEDEGAVDPEAWRCGCGRSGGLAG